MFIIFVAKGDKDRGNEDRNGLEEMKIEGMQSKWC